MAKARVKGKAKARKRSTAGRRPVAAPAVRLPRIAKGRKPRYFSDPATDKLLWMTLTLMEELSVARDRIDTLERLLAKKGVLHLAEVERFEPDAAAASERAARRGAYVERMMRAMHAELEEAASGHDPHAEAVRAVEG